MKTPKKLTKAQRAAAFKLEQEHIISGLKTMIASVQSEEPLWKVEADLISINDSHKYFEAYAPAKLRS
tara:strand:+ start:1515 stop:1718 length:204 start_codon:yes stop_codon:yes gene_type:complete